MPSDGVALAQLFVMALLGLIAILQAWRLETRIEAGFARVEVELGELDTAVKQLAGAVVPEPRPSPAEGDSRYKSSPALEETNKSCGRIATDSPHYR